MKKNLLKWGLLTLMCAFTTIASAEITQDDFSFLPANGSTQTSLNQFMVTYEDGISLSSTSDASQVTISYPSGTTAAPISCFAEGETSVLFNINALNSSGTYTITIPAGFFLLGESSEESPEINLTYIIGEEVNSNVEYEFTLTPDYGDHVTSLSTITIGANAMLEFNEDFAELYEDYGDDYDKIVVLDTSDNIVASASADDEDSWEPIYDEEDEDVKIGFTFTLSSTITEPGRYLYIIPAGYFCLGSLTNLSSQFSATVYVDGEEDTTGISSVLQNTVSDGVYYNLSGQRVTAPSKGVYILNGKKLLVK
ncbi:MAG: Ig-like domain-containing protein [Prevotella sp.]|nr:Ig-like domain-containing protein [Prevotella sp.]